MPEFAEIPSEYLLLNVVYVCRMYVVCMHVCMYRCVYV